MGERFDGFSLYSTKPDAEQFKVDKRIEGDAEVYSFPYRAIFIVIISQETYDLLQELQDKEIFGNRYAFPQTLEAGQIVEIK